VLQYHFNWKTISVAAAMTLWSFYFQIFEKAIAKEQVVEFLAYLVQQLPYPLLIVWDRLPAHRSRLVAEFVELLQGQIVLEYLPPRPHPGNERGKLPPQSQQAKAATEASFLVAPDSTSGADLRGRLPLRPKRAPQSGAQAYAPAAPVNPSNQNLSYP
jgi:hypothetical protein